MVFYYEILAIIVYDFFLLFPSEVQHFWTGRLSLTSVLFFLNRYVWLVLAPFTLWTQFVDFSHEV
jgi:hypothetical protein